MSNWQHAWRFAFSGLDAKKIENAFRRMAEGFEGIRGVKLHGSGLPSKLAVTVELDDGKGELVFRANEDLGASLVVESRAADNERLGETIAEVAAAVAAELGGEEEEPTGVS